MRYWDSSALAPLLVEESSSAALRRLVGEDDHIIVTWSWSHTEVVSAIERRCRKNSHSRAQRQVTLTQFTRFAASWNEISDIMDIRARAHELLTRYRLRTANVGHLAAALVLQARLDALFDFVYLDNQLSKAAELEGAHKKPEPSVGNH